MAYKSDKMSHAGIIEVRFDPKKRLTSCLCFVLNVTCDRRAHATTVIFFVNFPQINLLSEIAALQHKRWLLASED